MNESAHDKLISAVELPGIKTVNWLEYAVYISLILILLTSLSFDIVSVLADMKI